MTTPMSALLALIACGSSTTGDSATPTQPTDTDTGTPSTTVDTQDTEPSTDTDTGTVPTDTEPPPEPYGDHDLDADGIADSALSVGGCAAATDATCLAVDSRVTAVTEVRLSELPDLCWAIVAGSTTAYSDTWLVGDHSGDGLAEVSVAHCPSTGETHRTTLSVVDPGLGTLVGQAQAPEGLLYASVAHPADPDGLLHPVLTTSYGDGLYTAWARACVYRPDLASDPDCGTGFAGMDVPASTAEFREVGGTVQDVDGDGWQEIALIYHNIAWYGSVSSLTEVGRVTYDVAESTEPDSPTNFHSGRNYGTHRAHTGADGVVRTTIIGGAPLGSFTDYNCNVSRFVAVLDQTAGLPETRRLAWAHYYGFASTLFTTYDPAYTSDPEADIGREADVMDGCVHRFRDSRTVMDGEHALLVNYFAQDAPTDLCLDEQWDLYQDPAWTDEKADTWYGCFAANVASPGVWSMQVFRESDGVGLTGGQQNYVWGWNDQLMPDGEIVYLVEELPGIGRFDLADRTATALQVKALVSGLWSSRGTLPVAGRPLLRASYPTGSLGLGSYSWVSELILDDVDGDGLQDLTLADGTVVGWDTATEAFVVR